MASASNFFDIQDTEAFVAANDDMIIVVFRGTKEFEDWRANAKLAKRECRSDWGVPGGGKLHSVSECSNADFCNTRQGRY